MRGRWIGAIMVAIVWCTIGYQVRGIGVRADERQYEKTITELNRKCYRLSPDKHQRYKGV